MEGAEHNSWVSGCGNWKDGLKTIKTSQIAIMLR